MIKDRARAKKMLEDLGHRHASDEEMRDLMFKEGLNAIEIMEILDELIKEQLGTDKGREINMPNIQLVMRAMLDSKMSADKMWTYLEQFGVPIEVRVELLSQIKDSLTPTEFLCTLCGESLKELGREYRKCPKCDYAIIKVLRDMKVKEGLLTKEQVIDKLVSSNEFTTEEKDMIR